MVSLWYNTDYEMGNQVTIPEDAIPTGVANNHDDEGKLCPPGMTTKNTKDDGTPTDLSPEAEEVSEVTTTSQEVATSLSLMRSVALSDLRNKHQINNIPMMDRHVVPKEARKKIVKINKEQLAAEAKELFSFQTNTQDALLAILSSATGSGTVWERRMSPFFVLCSILKICPMCVSTKEGTERKVLRTGSLKNNGWIVPQSGCVPKQIKPIFDEGYTMICQAYELKASQIEATHSLRMEGMVELETSPLPPYPKRTWYNSIIRFARLHLNRLWYADPGSETIDVRYKVIKWATDNLKETKTEDEFKSLVNWHVDYQICLRIQAEKPLAMPAKYQEIALFCEQNRNCSQKELYQNAIRSRRAFADNKKRPAGNESSADPRKVIKLQLGSINKAISASVSASVRGVKRVLRSSSGSVASAVVNPAGANLGPRPGKAAGNKAGIGASARVNARVNGGKRAAKQSGARSNSTKSVPSVATNKKGGDAKEQPAATKEVMMTALTS